MSMNLPKTGKLDTNCTLSSLGTLGASNITSYQNWTLSQPEKGRQNNLLAEFLSWAELYGARGQGTTDLISPARRLLKWLEEQGLEVIDLDRRLAKSYRLWLQEYTSASGQSLAPRTIAVNLQVARKLGRFLVDTSRLGANPFIKITPPRCPKTVLREVPKESELQKVLDALAQWEDAGAHPLRQARAYLAHVLAELQYATGLRVCELAVLEETDIDLDRGLVKVREGKMGRSRWAYLNDYAAQVLKIYLTQMRPLVMTGKQEANSQLIFGAAHQSLGRVQNAHLRAVSERFGLKINCHTLRHALGYHLLRSGCPLRQIQEILGHVSIKDTEIYTKVDGSEVQAVVDACHPRGIRSLGNAS